MIKQSEKEALFCIFAFFIFHIEARSALHRVLHQPTKRERGLPTYCPYPTQKGRNKPQRQHQQHQHTGIVRRLALAPAAFCFALAPAANTHRHTDRLSPNPQKTRSRGPSERQPRIPADSALVFLRISFRHQPSILPTVDCLNGRQGELRNNIQIIPVSRPFVFDLLCDARSCSLAAVRRSAGCKANSKMDREPKGTHTANRR